MSYIIYISNQKLMRPPGTKTSFCISCQSRGFMTSQLPCLMSVWVATVSELWAPHWASPSTMLAAVSEVWWVLWCRGYLWRSTSYLVAERAQLPLAWDLCCQALRDVMVVTTLEWCYHTWWMLPQMMDVTTNDGCYHWQLRRHYTQVQNQTKIYVSNTSLLIFNSYVSWKKKLKNHNFNTI